MSNGGKSSRKMTRSQTILTVLGILCLAAFFIVGGIAAGGTNKPMPGWSFIFLAISLIFLLLAILPEISTQVRNGKLLQGFRKGIGEAEEKRSSATDSSPVDVTKTSDGKKGKVIEICLSNDEIMEYEDFSRLGEDIRNGNLKRGFRARIKGSKDPKWHTLEQVSKIDMKLQALYRPIHAYTMKFSVYGAIAGFVIKALDTTWLFFQIDTKLFLVWLIIVASLFAGKWWSWAPIAAIAISVASGIRANLFLSVITVMIVGGIFGAPAGMILGTIAGHFNKGKIPRSPDAVDEGAKPYLVGLLAPLIFLGIAFPLYWFWLNPFLLSWLYKNPINVH